MLTIADQSDVARHTPRTSRRSALLAAVADPANWHPADCRPAYRDALKTTQLPAAVRSWGCWLADRFTPAGDLALRGGIAALISVSPVSRAQTYRYLAQLERAGLIERIGATRKVAEREYRRATILRVAVAIRGDAPHVPDLRKSQLRDSRSKPFNGSVGDQRTDRYARETSSEQIDDESRRAVDEHWPLCARAPSDVPRSRPGYGVNTHDPAERERLLLPPIETLLVSQPVNDEPEVAY